MRLRVTVLLLVLVTALALMTRAGLGASLEPAADSNLRVLEQSVQPDFPYTVTFTLRTSGYEAESADLVYAVAGEDYSGSEYLDFDAPTSAISASLQVKLYENYMPPDTEITYWWELYSPSGATAITPRQTFTMLDDRFEWKTLSDEAGRVHVHWYAGANDFGSETLAVATRGLDRLESTIGLTLDTPARVWIYADRIDWVAAQPPDTPDWAGGRAYPESSLTMLAITEGMTRDRNIRRAVPHEISHLAFYQATHNPGNPDAFPPSWLNEGIAMWAQENFDPNEDLRPVRVAAEEGNLIPLEELDLAFGEAEDLTSAGLAYAQSRSVVEFLLTDSRYGREKLARLFDAFRAHADSEDALQAALGVSTAELDRQWREALPYDMPSIRTPAARPAQGGASQATGGIGLFPALLCFAAPMLVGVAALIVVVRRERAASKREQIE